MLKKTHTPHSKTQFDKTFLKQKSTLVLQKVLLSNLLTKSKIANHSIEIGKN